MIPPGTLKIAEALVMLLIMFFIKAEKRQIFDQATNLLFTYEN